MLPHAYDPVSKRPSFRLLAAYSSFLLALGSLIKLHSHPEYLIATCLCILFFALCMVFYMLKRLDSAKIDLDDQQISINSEKTVDNSIEP